MATATTIPITVEPEAAARIAELGMQREFEQMIEHAQETLPGLISIQVTLEFDPSGLQDPGIVIWSRRKYPGNMRDQTDEQFGMWKVSVFPPQVCIHFCMISLYRRTTDGG